MTINKSIKTTKAHIKKEIAASGIRLNNTTIFYINENDSNFYTDLETLSFSLAHRIIAPSDRLVRIEYQGTIYNTMATLDLCRTLCEISEANPSALRVRAFVNELADDGIENCINSKTGVFTDPRTGNKHQLTWINNDWYFSNRQLQEISGLSDADFQRGLKEFKEKYGR